MCLLIGLCGWLAADAQNLAIESRGIMESVNKVFAGMAAGDSALVSSVFTRDAMLVTVTSSDGKPGLRTEGIQKFLNAIGSPHEQTWNEPIWDAKINVDGNLAHVWTKYAFYLGNQFSHCGVDSFSLIKGDDGKYRIFHLIDTRQKEGCNVPKAINDKHTK
jgi:hypothetical protein